jgi:hypothetical protein
VYLIAIEIRLDVDRRSSEAQEGLGCSNGCCVKSTLEYLKNLGRSEFVSSARVVYDENMIELVVPEDSP